MKKLFRYMIIATMIVIFIYSVFFDKPKNKKQPDVGVTAKVETVADIAAAIDSVAATCPATQEARHMEQVARWSLVSDSGYPRWPLSELLSDLREVYRIIQRYERGDSIDTARVIELEKKLNCLTN